MTQVELRHKDGRVQVTWIETAFAIVGKLIKVKATNENWLVTERYATLDKDRVYQDSHDFGCLHDVTDAYRDKDGHWVTPEKPRE